MNVPAAPSTLPRTPPRPLEGREWFVARASLAMRRSSRFARLWSVVVGPLAALALAVPFISSDPGAADRSRFERQVAETLLTAQQIRRAESAVAAAESLIAHARMAPELPRVIRPVRALPASGHDPVATSLDAAIREARRLRTVPAWLAVAAEPPLSGGPRMRSLADTLGMLARQRDALPTGPQRDQQLAALTQRIGRLGYTILAIADNRLAELVAAAGVPATTGVITRPVRPSDSGPDSRPDSGVGASGRADTTAFAAALSAARDTLARARRQHDSLGVAIEQTAASLVGADRSRLAAATPALLLLLVLVVGLLARLGMALRAEMRAPTVATAHEAERISGSPVVAIVREALLDGPARYRPSGVDPFRMLYLGLTATGTRARTAIITGSDPVINAAVAGRLAIAAAADHRTTLVVDLDPREIALARTFRERAEPGLTDALAGAFKWREVARPVGSSDGLPITLIPAGTERDDLPEGEDFARVREEFARFRGSHELTILVAGEEFLARALALVESTPLVLCASKGASIVAEFAQESARLRAEGHRVHGIVLWEALRPQLPSRAELAALLSKRKGRTPGGSFEAVQRAVAGQNKQQK